MVFTESKLIPLKLQIHLTGQGAQGNTFQPQAALTSFHATGTLGR